jgi:hypothetical protein
MLPLLLLALVAVFPALYLERRFRVRRAARRIDASLRAVYSGAHVYRSASLDEFPHLDAAFYEGRTAELHALGFAPLGEVEDTTISAAGPSLPTVIRILRGDDGATVAAMYNLKVKRLGILVISVSAVDLVTTFTDGTFVSTSTAHGAAGMDLPPEIDTEYLAADTPVPLLLRRHAERLAAHAERRPDASPLRVASLDEVLRHQERMDEIKARFRKSRATMVTPDELMRVGGAELREEAEEVGEEMRRQARRK